MECRIGIRVQRPPVHLPTGIYSTEIQGYAGERLIWLMTQATAAVPMACLTGYV